MRHLLRLLFFPLLALLPACGAEAPDAPVPSDDLAEIRTPAEASGWARHTSHDEMLDFLSDLEKAGGELRIERYGESREGRDLVLVRLGASTPEAAHASGRPILLLGANVHGFNYTLRESLLLLIRELATPGTELNRLLDRMVVLVAPSKNPDGLEAESRFNAAGADLNRDYMTLDQPETAALVGSILHTWRPHLWVDGHDGGAVQYGGAQPYTLLYQAPATAAADPTLTEFADREIFPAIGARFEGEGLEAFYWARGESDAWHGGGSAPRMGRNYGGLSDIVTLLFEVAAWPEWSEAVDAGVLALTTVLEFAHDDSDRLIDTVESARQRTLELAVRGEAPIPVEERMEAEPEPVRYRIPDPERPGSFVTITDGELVKRPVGLRFRERPWAYLLPPEATEAVALLRRHGIEVHPLETAIDTEVRSYRLAVLHAEEGRDESESVTRVEIGAVEDAVRNVEAGSWLVRTDQPLGRVVTHLLEAETTESVIYWGRMDGILPVEELQQHLEAPETHPAPLVPILKVMHAVELPVRSSADHPLNVVPQVPVLGLALLAHGIHHVADGDDPPDPAVLHDGEVADPVLRENLHHVRHVISGERHDEFAGHGLLDGQGRERLGSPVQCPENVTLGEDPQGLLPVLHQ